MDIKFLTPALDIPRYHHERWDGKGCPYGLKGEQIPIAARIFAIIDAWDALTSDRPYRPRYSGDEALRILQGNSGILYDPKVVKAFFEFIQNSTYDYNWELTTPSGVKGTKQGARTRR